MCYCLVGVEPAQVQERVENHLKNLLIKHFDPQKADSIFTVEGEVSFFRWLIISVPSIHYVTHLFIYLFFKEISSFIIFPNVFRLQRGWNR